ncbi:MAG: NTP transferase domain-containing protein [Hyphomonadaceae bacterium]|nr:NTP transferase domain-containing protein [Hyphomonadaceae bacterium]
MTPATLLSGEHAEDVLSRLSDWIATAQKCALVFVTATEGGAVRAPGALLAVGEQTSIGYISGGCIDADVELQARQACAKGESRALRYGAGSPFVDLPLPCGGAIEVFIACNPDITSIMSARDRLISRQEAELIVRTDGTIVLGSDIERPAHGDHVFTYCPKLRLRIAGRGADALALARVSDAAGYATHLQLVDDEDLENASAAGLPSLERLSTPAAISANTDDAWTAFVLLFHDQDWEVPLLQQAVRGPAFYVGAVGSRRTHANRCDALKTAGCSAEEIAAIHGPIGLVPSLRDASMLAISTLAEIVGSFPARSSSRRPRTALLMLAAGASSRFETGDKLLADLDGLSVLERAASNVPGTPDLIKVAIISSETPRRREILERQGWRTIENSSSHLGQSTSLKLGIEALQNLSEIDQVIVLLGDMPFVPATHIEALRQCADLPSTSCVMSESDGVISPPALFKREHFGKLIALEGDRGAKAIYQAIEHGNVTVPLPDKHAADIDVLADLERAKEVVDA